MALEFRLTGWVLHGGLVRRNHLCSIRLSHRGFETVMGWTLFFGALGLISIGMLFLTDQIAVRVIYVVLLALCLTAVVRRRRKSRTQ